jgi:hypothetical protein
VRPAKLRSSIDLIWVVDSGPSGAEAERGAELRDHYVMPEFETPEPIRSLLPRGPGHHFVIYGDSCSGIPGAPHEQTFSAVNAVLRRLTPPPEFVLFAGDEIAGLTADSEELRAQCRYWLEHEMGWLDRQAIPPGQASAERAKSKQIGYEGCFIETPTRALSWWSVIIQCTRSTDSPEPISVR